MGERDVATAAFGNPSSFPEYIALPTDYRCAHIRSIQCRITRLPGPIASASSGDIDAMQRKHIFGMISGTCPPGCGVR